MSLVLLSAHRQVAGHRHEHRYARGRQLCGQPRGDVRGRRRACRLARSELSTVADWNALLSSGALSGFVDGPPTGARPLGRRHHGRFGAGDERGERRVAAVGREQSRSGGCSRSGGLDRGPTSSCGPATTPRRTTGIRRLMAAAWRTLERASSRCAPRRSGPAAHIRCSRPRSGAIRTRARIVHMLSWHELR